MSILETIYASYMSCGLSLQPERVESHISEKISEIVKLCDMNSEQAFKFEDMLFDILDYDGKNMFFAGFKSLFSISTYAYFAADSAYFEGIFRRNT